MDDVAPPPFRGMHEEPPDDIQIGLYDDEDETHDDSSHDPDNLPPVPEVTYDYPDEIYVPPIPTPSTWDAPAEMEPSPSSDEVAVTQTETTSVEERSLDITDASDVVETDLSLSELAVTQPDISSAEENSLGHTDATGAIHSDLSFSEVAVTQLEISSVEDSSLDQVDVPEVVEKDRLSPAASTNDSPPMETVEEDDDFGDFADFTSAPAPSASSTSEGKSNEDDDWGGFGAPGPLSAGLSKSVSVDKTEDDEEFWGDFSEPSAKPAEDDDSDWAADFKSAVPADAPAIKIPEPSESLEDLLEDDSLWTSYDEDSSSEEDNKVLSITEFLESDDIPDSHEFRSSVDLWRLLRIVEDADALKFEWKVAQINLNLLKHLKIDNVVTKKPESLSFPGSSTLQSTLLQPTKPDESKSDKRLTPSPTVENEKDSSLSSKPSLTNGHAAAASVESVPPVDFDWDDSGLTNPMNGAARSSALLDIDFLSANDGASSSAASTLEKDLEDFGLSSTVSQAPSTSTVLDNLLSSAGVSAKATRYKPVAELSLDAKALHDQLPDLDYLRSQIIMFPLGGIGNSFSG